MIDFSAEVAYSSFLLACFRDALLAIAADNIHAQGLHIDAL